MANYRVEYQLGILDPSMIVIVVEDTIKMDENDSVYDALKEICPPLPDDRSERVIVGVASVDVTKSSWDVHFMPEALDQQKPNPDPDDLERDKDQEVVAAFRKAKNLAKERWFSNRLELSSIAVHPAYWRSGHGTALTKWVMDLVDALGEDIGVSASPMSRILFQRAGFQLAELVKIPGCRNHPDPIDLWFGVRDQKREGFVQKPSSIPL